MATSWYYAMGGKQMGPVAETELDSLVSSGVVRGDTLVWRDGLAEWQPYNIARPESPAPPALPSGEPQGETRYCTECGQPRLSRELVAFGDRLVCFNCKDAFAQRLREQGASAKRFQYAGFWIRFLARILDAILLYIVLLPATFLILGRAAFTTNAETPTPEFIFLTMVYTFLQMACSAAYEVFFLVRYGATPGKMAVAKKVVTADGGPLSVGRAIGRHFAVYLSSFTLGIGFIMAAFDEEKRSLHDRICDTRVIAK